MGTERRDAFREIDELKRQIHALKEYIHLRDGTPFDELYERIEEVRIDYSSVPDEQLRSQLEKDNLMMLRARALDDFWAYCQSAILQLEAILNYALTQLHKTDQSAIEAAWDRQQGERVKRNPNYVSNKFNTKKIPISDLLELFYIYLYNKIDANYWKLVNTNKIRNKASHRDGSQKKIEDLEARLSKFYKKRHEEGYHEISYLVKKILNDIMKKIKDAGSQHQGH